MLKSVSSITTVYLAFPSSCVPPLSFPLPSPFPSLPYPSPSHFFSPFIFVSPFFIFMFSLPPLLYSHIFPLPSSRPFYLLSLSFPLSNSLLSFLHLYTSSFSSSPPYFTSISSLISCHINLSHLHSCPHLSQCLLTFPPLLITFPLISSHFILSVIFSPFSFPFPPSSLPPGDNTVGGGGGGRHDIRVSTVHLHTTPAHLMQRSHIMRGNTI